MSGHAKIGRRTHQLLAHIVDRHAPKCKLHLSAGSVCLTIHSDNQQLVEQVADDCAPYLIRGSPTSSSSDGRETILVTVDRSLAAQLGSIADATQAREHAEGAHVAAGHLHLAAKRTGLPPARSDGYVIWSSCTPGISHVVLIDDGELNARLLLRVVRAIGARLLINCGWVPLRAACYRTPVGAVCLAGPTSSGKTTTLLGALAAGDGDFLANDQVFVGEQDGRLTARGLPTAISIRWDAVKRIPPLEALARQAQALHPENPAVTPPIMSRTASRLVVPPGSLAAALGAQVVPADSLRALVAIRFGSRSGGRPVPIAERATELRSHQLERLFPDDPHEAKRLRRPEPQLRAAHRQALAQWGTTLPMARLHPGRDPAAELRNLLTELLD